ncbi:MAG: RNA polymerase factor sigma-54 [Neisseria sp.]|nr:RNA polymerase factor sigma-54 [Neisseria sp.]
MKLSGNIILEQTQQLQLTPQLRQLVMLLQLPSTDLEQLVNDALQDNPLLEKAESADKETLPLSPLTASITASPYRHGDTDDDALAAVAAEPDFYDYLHAQVCEMTDDPRQAQLLHILIESLNEHGYLSESLDDIIEHAPLEWHLQQDELAAALKTLQGFDPAGVGAADIRESLLLQLQRLPNDIAVRRARDIVRDHFPLLTQVNHLSKLKKALSSNDHIIQAALDTIQKLNPYPNSGFAGVEDTVYVRPDVRVYKEKGVWCVAGEAHLRPRVMICEEYAAAVKAEAGSTWKKKLSEAKMLINNLELRENTILQVARAIVAKQQDFFEFGSAALNPLRLIDIAEELDIHMSTVSRSVNQKYLTCPQGLFELRLFFSNLVGHEDVEQGMSSTAIKAHIEEWIRGEDKTRPLSDEALRQKLAAADIDIARRTVVKYREELNIPSSYRRKTGGK